MLIFELIKTEMSLVITTSSLVWILTFSKGEAVGVAVFLSW